MKDNYLLLAAKMLDMDYIKKHTFALYEIERATSNCDNKKAADYISNLMEEAGFSNIDCYTIPCDGKTTYDDCTMPQAWDRTGRSTLEVVSGNVDKEDEILADTDIELLNAAIWSPPTPPEGITGELISFNSLKDNDYSIFAGKIVLCDFSPIGKVREQLANAGALGLVSYVGATLETNPNDVRWMNGVGHSGWYYVKEDKQLWNFSITPKRGKMLEDKLASGEQIILKAVMNTKVYDGSTYTVTGVIPGESSEELAFFGHMYEPFLGDNSAGIILAIAIAKALNDLATSGAIPKLEKSIRVVFGMERYGFSEYFSHEKNTKKIIAAMNMDSVCHASLKFAGVPLQMRHSTVTAPFFAEAILTNYLKKYYPDLTYQEAAGCLSDDTFCADPTYNVPCGWLFTPPAENLHHNTGDVFGAIDWQVTECIFNVITAYYIEIATLKDGNNVKSLVKKVIKKVKEDAINDFKKLEKMLANDQLNSYAVNVIGEYLTNYHVKRVTAINKLVKKAVKSSDIKDKISSLRKKYAPSSLKLDIYELTNIQLRMAYMTVSRINNVSLLMSLIRVPIEERTSFEVLPSNLLCALLDGKRNLYAAYVISKFILGEDIDSNECTTLVANIKKLATYGYYDIQYAKELTTEDLNCALDALKVKASDKVVVHSAYGSLGGVEGGAAAVAKVLVDRIGQSGVLMMPSFNFPFYMGNCQDEYFDVKETPSCVGIISEEFRKLPNVFRSLNPSHSMAVYGKNNFSFVKDHHKVTTMDQDSPLGKLEKAKGYALMIGCPDSVTFMHVVEMTNNVHCLGKRTEEFAVKLPDGRVENIRTWGWRSGSCPAYNRNKIFNYLRKHKLIKEVMVRHSLWQFFKLSDYRKAYKKVVLQSKCGCMQCNIQPRVVKNTVASDWNNKKNKVNKDTTAFTGDWKY